MTSPTLILITGMPGAGKTTLAHALAKDLAWPCLTKDAIKERLFDTLGWSDRAWSQKASLAAFRIIDYVAAEQLGAGRSLILESNFSPEHDTPRFRGWQKTYDVGILQILCQANGDVLYQRFQTRVESGERHPGHADGQNLAEWKRTFQQQPPSQVLELGGPVIRVDTTDFATVSTDAVVAEIKRFAER